MELTGVCPSRIYRWVGMAARICSDLLFLTANLGGREIDGQGQGEILISRNDPSRRPTLVLYTQGARGYASLNGI